MRRVVIVALVLGIVGCGMVGCGKEPPAAKTNINLKEKGWLPPTAKSNS
jgi:hypothetical protein